ncbi:tyramine octopamine receptor, partial [Brachionus plicatilis]
CVFLLICFTCIFGNILVILSVFTYRPLQSVQNIFIVSLALADTFVAIFVMPFHVSSFLSNGKWLFSAFICHFFLTLDILLCTSSILHLCCIALDRYWAIKDSIKYAQKRTLKRVMIMIMIAWGLSALISLPVIIWNMKSVRSEPSSWSSDYIRDEHRANITVLDDQIVCDIPHDKLYRFYSSSGTFFVPLLIMTFVYVRIYLETKRRLHERAKAAKKLAKSVANSSSRPPLAHNKKPRRKHIHSLECFCCIQKNKTLVKVENNQALGAYLEQTDIGDEAQRSNRKTLDPEELDEKTVAFNRQSDKSKNDSSLNSPEKTEKKKDLQAESAHLVNKVSIGINTVSLGKEEDKEAEKSKRTDLIAGSESDRHNQVLSSTWIRNPASSGTTLKQRQKISLTRERRAARTLGIIMGAFSICWLPFFIVYLLQSFDYFTNGYGLFEFLTWLGYVNSALNPIIYTIFNIDFRKSFERILFKCILFRR